MYHMNPKTGEISRCRAKSPKTCPFGEEYHGFNREEMLEIADLVNEERIKKEVAEGKMESPYKKGEWTTRFGMYVDACRQGRPWATGELTDAKDPVGDPITTLDMGYIDLKASKKYLRAVDKAKKLSEEELIKEASKDRAINSAYREELCNRLMAKDSIKEKMELSELNTKKLFEETEEGKTYRFMYNPSNNELEKYGFFRDLTYDSRNNVNHSYSPEEFTEMLHKDIDKALNELSEDDRYKDLIEDGKARINIEFMQGEKRKREYGGEFNMDHYLIRIVEYSDKPFDDDLDKNEYYHDMQLNKKFNEENPNYRNGLYKDKIPVNDETVYSCMKERRYFKEALDYYRQEEEKGNAIYFMDMYAPISRKTFLLKNKVDLKLNANDENVCRVKKVLFDHKPTTSANSQVFNPFYECDIEATAALYAEKDGRLTPEFIKEYAEEMYLDPSGKSGCLRFKKGTPSADEVLGERMRKYERISRFGDIDINDPNHCLVWEMLGL